METTENKTKREDRKEKLKNRSFEKEKVIKCKLKSHLKINSTDKNKIVILLQQISFNYSNRVFNATLLLNLMIRDIFKQKVDINNVPNITDQTFIRQVMLGSDKSRKTDPFINNYFKQYPELFYETNNRHLYDSNIYTSGAQMIGTNIKNHFVTNFEKFLRKYLRSINSLNNYQQFYIVNDLFGLKIGNKNIILNNFEKPKSINEEDKKISIKKSKEKSKKLIEECNVHITFLRNILELKDSVITDFWLQQKSLIILRFFVFINKHLESLNEQNLTTPYKLINILPIAKIKNHFITLDSSGFQCLVKNSGIEDYEWLDFDTLIDHKNLRETNDWKFTGTIQTDGTVICIHYTKQLNIKKTKKVIIENKPINKTDRVIAFDPGRINILYGVEEVEENKYKSYKLTRRQYYTESGIFKVRKKTESINLKHKDILESLSKNSPKSVKLENFHKYLEIVNKNKEILFDEYTKPLWSNMRFELYCKKKKVLSKFFNSLKNRNDNRKIVIAYGNAKFNSTGKGEMAVPTDSVYKHCKNMYQTNLVDEFRTSKLYHKDHSLLNLVSKRSSLDINEAKSQSLRGLLWYCSTNKSSNFVNRDLNAAINILNLSKCKDRPLIFQRDKNNSLPKQKIEKKI
jgi:hypothetical protein